MESKDKRVINIHNLKPMTPEYMNYCSITDGCDYDLVDFNELVGLTITKIDIYVFGYGKSEYKTYDVLFHTSNGQKFYMNYSPYEDEEAVLMPPIGDAERVIGFPIVAAEQKTEKISEDCFTNIFCISTMKGKLFFIWSMYNMCEYNGKVDFSEMYKVY